MYRRSKVGEGGRARAQAEPGWSLMSFTFLDLLKEFHRFSFLQYRLLFIKYNVYVYCHVHSLQLISIAKLWYLAIVGIYIISNHLTCKLYSRISWDFTL